MNRPPLPPESAPASTVPPPLPTRILGGLALLLLLGAAAEHLHHAWRVVTFPYDLDNGEAFVLNQSAMFARGESPWQSIDEEPYLVSNFAPLYQAIVALAIRAGGLSFAWGRALSVLATLSTALAIFLLVRRRHGGAFAPSIAALLFLSSKFVYDWTGLHRIDALAMALTAWGLYVAVRARRAEWAAIPFALALLTRQTMVFGPLAVSTWLLRRGRAGEGLRLAAASFGVPAAAFLALDLLTRGEFFRHVFAYNVQPYSWALVRTFAEHWIWFHPGFLALGLFFVAWRATQRRPGLPSIYLGLAIVSFFLCGRVGAASNYMFQLVAGLAIVAGIVVAQFGRLPGPAGHLSRWLLLSSLVVQSLVSHLAFRSYDVLPTPDADDVARARELGRLIAATEGACLAEDAGWLLLNGKAITFEPYMMSRLAESGVWDPAPVIRDVSARRFALVLLNFDVETTRSVRFDDRITDAIRNHYRSVRRVPGPGGSDRAPSPWWNWWVYVPRDTRAGEVSSPRDGA